MGLPQQQVIIASKEKSEVDRPAICSNIPLMSVLTIVDDLNFDEIRYYDVDDYSIWRSCYHPDDPNIVGGEVREGPCTGLSAAFTFWGTQVSVFGRVEPVSNGSNSPVSLYSVGSDITQEFRAPNVSTPHDNITFFESSIMPYGQYTLVINISHASADAPYFLDYIRFNGSDPGIAGIVSSTTASVVPTASTTNVSSAFGASSPASASSVPGGAIIGAVLGGTVFLALILALFFFCLPKKRRHMPGNPSSQDEKLGSTKVDFSRIPSHTARLTHPQSALIIPANAKAKQQTRHSPTINAIVAPTTQASISTASSPSASHAAPVPLATAQMIPIASAPMAAPTIQAPMAISTPTAPLTPQLTVASLTPQLETASPLVIAQPEHIPVDDEVELTIIPPVVGIDFGTTHSYVSVQQGDRVEIIPNEEGERDTPSWVSFTGDKRLIGTSAKNAFELDPQNTVFGFKRLIGCDFDDPELQKEIKHLPFKVFRVGNKPKVQVKECGTTRKFTPEELTAMVFRKLKENAEVYLGQKVVQAVVTVPAYFNGAQRQATKDAAEMAGLQIVRIIHESTAAATAYSLNMHQSDKALHVFVYRLGGGTFDVSVISIKGGESKVLANAGDTTIGGMQFDRLLLNYIVARHRSKSGIDIRANPCAFAKLRNDVEKAKQALSNQESTTIDIEGQDGRMDFSETLTRATFEELIKDTLQRTMHITGQVLAEAGLRKWDIDDIITVGGSTRISKVQQLLQDYFGKAPSASWDPEKVAAYGTGVQGAIIAGHKDYYKLAVRDNSSHTLGINTVGGVMSPIIPRNTPIPTSKSEMYTTVVDWQTLVEIKVYEGENILTRQNHLLGQFDFRGIPRARRGVPQIKVTFKLDANGIMKVTALDTKTDNSKSITLSNVLRRTRS